MGLVIEGTIAEVQQRLSAMPISPETRLRVIVEDENSAEKEKRNGVTLFPVKASGVTVTAEMVNALMEEE